MDHLEVIIEATISSVRMENESSFSEGARAVPPILPLKVHWKMGLHPPQSQPQWPPIRPRFSARPETLQGSPPPPHLVTVP